MDVHPPHKPITNISEFFLHLFTITIGLLIAVGIHQEQAAIEKDLNALKRIQANPDDKQAQDASLNAQFRVVGLDGMAWKTAQATEALTYMPYEKARQYADIYSAQDEFTAAEEKQLEDEAAFMGVVQKLDKLPKLTPELTEEALERFGIWKAHLTWMSVMAKRCDLTYKAFLEGKPFPTSIHEDLK